VDADDREVRFTWLTNNEFASLETSLYSSISKSSSSGAFSVE
jgi:hypothetical protein